VAAYAIALDRIAKAMAAPKPVVVVA